MKTRPKSDTDPHMDPHGHSFYQVPLVLAVWDTMFGIVEDVVSSRFMKV